MLIVNEFITEEEQQEFLNWTDKTEIPVLTPKRPDLHPVNATFPRSIEITTDNVFEAYTRVQQRIKERYDLKPSGIPRQGKVFIHGPNTRTPSHKDYVSTHRVTLLIKKAEQGGDLLHDGTQADVSERGIAYFNATKPHEVTSVVSGERVVFIFEFA